MKTKILYFFVLWGLLVLVQISAILLVNFTSLLESVIITGIGTMLTLYLGLKVERKRVAREEETKRHQEAERIREAISKSNSNLFIMNGFSEPESFFLKDREDAPELFDQELYDYPVLHPSNVIQFPQRSEHFVMDDDSAKVVTSLLERSWEAMADADETAMSPAPGPDICKHCYRQIDGFVHTEGMNRGKMRCDPEDTLGGYGYNAEPTGVECSKTCLGHKNT